MKKSSVRPHLFSKRFGVDPKALASLGVFDPTLNIDTKLFPDPLLLEHSNHQEMIEARGGFEKYFEHIRKLLLGSSGDKSHPAWKSAYRLLSFPEVKGTCLGYGSGSISGSGSGPAMTARLADTGYKIARLGIDDPDLFMAMGLFEEDFGPDLIGDMFTNVCFGQIEKFNRRVYAALGIPTQQFKIKLKNGISYDAQFIKNPCFPDRDIPVILIPLDVLRALPVALDWSGVQSVSEKNQEFRDSLNSSLSLLWSKKTLESKSQLKEWALSDATAFGDLLDMIHGMDGKPYDFAGDKLGEIVWRSMLDRIGREYPFSIVRPTKLTKEAAVEIVDKILEQFRYLIENRDLWRELYTDTGQVRLEKSAQRLLYMTALSYCDANDLDITPEAETGRGPVDFKFSVGTDCRILVELKLSKNGQVLNGYTKQLAVYNSAERPVASRYVIVDVGNMGKKLKSVEAARDKQIATFGSAPKIICINGGPRVSASKLRD